MRILFWAMVLFTLAGNAQNQLAVDVYGVPKSEGKISVAVYKCAEDFLKFDKVFLFNSSAAKEGMTSVLLKNIPEGEYAVAIFYDKNGNDELDTNWLGIPKEKVAFSNAKMKTFGPPDFEDCAFTIPANTRISISL